MRWTAAILMALASLLGARAARSADPSTLEQSAAAIERASKAPDGDRVVVGHISRELGVSVETLRMQRVQTGLGWGEILIANHLSRPTGPTVNQVVAEFRSGKSWSAIARDHKVDLDRLITDVHRSQEVVEQRLEDRAPHTDVDDKPGAPSRGANRPNGGGTGRGGR